MINFWVKNKISGKNKAFGLIEVLIASVILAVGLLGVAVMQQKAMLLARSSENSSIANMLATEMSNRMKSNPVEAVKGATSAYVTPVNNLASTATITENCFNTTGCLSSEMAKTDLKDWSQQIATSLPNGNGLICLGTFAVPPATLTCTGITPNVATTSPSYIYTIEVGWTDIGTGAMKVFTVQAGN